MRTHNFLPNKLVVEEVFLVESEGNSGAESHIRLVSKPSIFILALDILSVVDSVLRIHSRRWMVLKDHRSGGSKKNRG